MWEPGPHMRKSLWLSPTWTQEIIHKIFSLPTKESYFFPYQASITLDLESQNE